MALKNGTLPELIEKDVARGHLTQDLQLSHFRGSNGRTESKRLLTTKAVFGEKTHGL